MRRKTIPQLIARVTAAAEGVIDDETPATRAELVYAVLELKEVRSELRITELFVKTEENR